MGHKLVSKIKQAAKPVTKTSEDIIAADAPRKEKGTRRMKIYTKRKSPPSNMTVLDVQEPPVTSRRVLLKKPSGYIQLEVKGSTGKIYTIVVPQSYKASLPRTWKWNARRYKVAELISAGYPITRIAKEVGVNKAIIYAWLQHPEFKEHVDGLTMETGWANQRERIAGLNRVTRLLFDKVVAELDGVNLTDKSIGPVLVAIQSIAKQIAQEKGEFIEQSKIDNNTTMSGTLGVAVANVDVTLASRSADERKALEGEFKSIGDDIIRGITGEKE